MQETWQPIFFRLDSESSLSQAWKKLLKKIDNFVTDFNLNKYEKISH